MNLSRRHLLSTAAAGAALTPVLPGLNVAFAADTPVAPPTDILVVIFQRGACDWLQMLSPAGDPNYIALRPTIRVQTTGNNPGIGTGTLDGVDFYTSASAPELKALYDTGKLAYIHATGIFTVDRSHFTCEGLMEKGVADDEPGQNSGWLARHISSLGATQPGLGVISSGSTTPVSLLGDSAAVAITDASNFAVSGGDANANVIRALNTGTTPYQTSAKNTLDAVASVRLGLQTIKDDSAAAGYTNGALSAPLRSLGKLIKMNVGLNVATVDYGGWDMHNALVREFATRTTEFSRAINAFWKDMANYQDRITLVVMTEFGRRLRENTSAGTDHGSGSAMMVLGGNVNGGKIYGAWPGLAPNQLVTGDLRLTTDYRQVLSEILVKRHGEKNLAKVFPTVSYRPVGFMK